MIGMRAVRCAMFGRGLQRRTARCADGGGDGRRIDARVAVGAAGEAGATHFEMGYRAGVQGGIGRVDEGAMRLKL